MLADAEYQLVDCLRTPACPHWRRRAAAGVEPPVESSAGCVRVPASRRRLSAIGTAWLGRRRRSPERALRAEAFARARPAVGGVFQVRSVGGRRSVATTRRGGLSFGAW